MTTLLYTTGRIKFFSTSVDALKSAILSIILLFSPLPIVGKIYQYQGEIDSSVEVYLSKTYRIDSRIKRVEIHIPKFQSFSNGINNQLVNHLQIFYTPSPSLQDDFTDEDGNEMVRAVWEKKVSLISMEIKFRGEIYLNLQPLISTAPFPLPRERLGQEEIRYLGETELVKADDPLIRSISFRVTSPAQSLSEAVVRLFHWVVDEIDFDPSAEEIDAISTLRERRGSGEGTVNLTLSLLRAVGIPSRAVGGISIHRPLTLPGDGATITIDYDQGNYHWVEVYFPDMGWIPMDPLTSLFFTPTNLIRGSSGLDTSKTGFLFHGESISTPGILESFVFEVTDERLNVSVSDIVMAPEGRIILSPPIPKLPPEMVRTQARVKTPEPKADRPDSEITHPSSFTREIKLGIREKLGNLDELATGNRIFAQGFQLDEPMLLKKIRLGLHKFGGEVGRLWVEIRSDQGGRPGAKVAKSYYRSVGKIPFQPGHAFESFWFPKGIILHPGRYWIVLRSSLDAILNWHCIQGNFRGDTDDSLFTPRKREENWDNIINVDFSYEIQGFSPE